MAVVAVVGVGLFVVENLVVEFVAKDIFLEFVVVVAYFPQRNVLAFAVAFGNEFAHLLPVGKGVEIP